MLTGTSACTRLGEHQSHGMLTAYTAHRDNVSLHPGSSSQTRPMALMTPEGAVQHLRAGWGHLRPRAAQSAQLVLRQTLLLE